MDIFEEKNISDINTNITETILSGFITAMTTFGFIMPETVSNPLTASYNNLQITLQKVTEKSYYLNFSNFSTPIQSLEIKLATSGYDFTMITTCGNFTQFEVKAAFTKLVTEAQPYEEEIEEA